MSTKPGQAQDAWVRAPDSVLTRLRAFTAHGQPKFAYRPYGLVDTTYYNAAGQVTEVRPATGPRATYTYDATGFMTQSDVDGVTINRQNGGWGQPKLISGDVTTQDLYLNSANGRVDSIRLAGNNAFKYRNTYDGYGRVLTATDPMGDLLRRSWYAGTNGNLSKDSQPGGRVTTYGHDGYGRGTTVSQAGLPTRTAVYDVLNRLTALYDSVYATPTQLTYDSLDLRIVTDAKGQTYQYLRDALGRVIGQIDPTGRRDTTDYGWSGEVRRYVNRRGQAVAMSYDSLLRPTMRSGANLTADTLSYSVDGRVVTGASETTIETLYFNKRGQPDSIKTVFRSDGSKVFWRRYSYDDRARVLSVLHTGSSVFLQSRTYDWSADGILSSLSLGGNPTTFGYNNDRRREYTYLPGTNHTITDQFSSVHSPIQQTSVAMTEKYHYDVTHRMDRAWHGGTSYRQEIYRYDGLGQLDSTFFQTGASFCWPVEVADGYICPNGSTDSTHSFAYDSVGNRRDHGGAYDTGNRITAFDGCTYGTDYDGNVTSRTCSGVTVAFEWNALNQLVGYTKNDTTVNLRYDASGQLVRQWGTPVTEQRFLWDRGHLYATLNATMNVALAQYSYYPGTDRPHATVVGSTQYFAHQDVLGNVRALTTSDKTVQRTYEYDEWGQLKGGGDNAGLAGRDRARFKGALWFGDGGVELYYMRNRWYEPKTGRFLSEDPIGLDGGINLYSFGANDPVNRYDPTGTQQCWATFQVYREYDNETGLIIRSWLVWTGEYWCTPEEGDNKREGGTGNGTRGQEGQGVQAQQQSCVMEGLSVLAALTVDWFTWNSGLGVLRAGTRAAGRIAEGAYLAGVAYTRGTVVGTRISQTAATRLMGEAALQLGMATPSVSDATHFMGRIANGAANPSAGGAEMLLDLAFFTPSAWRSFQTCRGN